VITGTLKSQIDRVWDSFWSGGISNPVEVIEQITTCYPVFLWWRNFRERRGSARGDSVRSAALGEPGALWALSYLGRYGAAERPNRGTSRITDAGRQLLTENADGVTVQQLRALAAEPNLNPAATEPQESGFDPVTDPTATALDPEEQVGARHHHDPRERRDRSPAPPARQRAGLIRTGSRRPAGGDGYGGTTPPRPGPSSPMTPGSTGSSTRTPSASAESTFGPSTTHSTHPSVGRRFRCSSECCTASRPISAC
jgi:hypothetical protein